MVALSCACLAAASACRTDESISCAQPLLTTISSKVATAKPFLAFSNATFFKYVQRIELIGLPGAWFAILAALVTGPARLALAARRPTPIGKELLLFSVHSFNVQRSWK
jgi:hypothetical protein